MLAYILAIALGLGSFALYMVAFFFPEVHRKRDFVWSGVGFFYALILWACAGRITGAVLLGQLASVSLIVWFGWEAIALRRASTPVALQTPIPADVKERLNGFLGRQSSVISPQSTPKINRVKSPEPVSPMDAVIPETPVEIQPKPEVEIITPSADVADIQEQKIVVEPSIPSTPPELEILVEETPESPTVEPSVSTPIKPVEIPKKSKEKSGVTIPKPAAKPQKSIPEIAGLLSGLVGNLKGFLNKPPKPKTPKSTPASQKKSPQPDPVSPASTVSDTATAAVESDFAEFEDLEATVSPPSDGVEGETPTTAEVTEEAVEKPAPSPFEQIAAPQVEVVVEITAEQVNVIVEGTQESIAEVEVNQVEPESVEEVMIVSEVETPTETSEESEETPSSPLVRPHPPSPDLKAAAQKPKDSNPPSESKPES